MKDKKERERDDESLVFFRQFGGRKEREGKVLQLLKNRILKAVGGFHETSQISARVPDPLGNSSRVPLELELTQEVRRFVILLQRLV